MSLQSLKKYAEWYYSRYFPSIQVLREKIINKSHNAEDVDSVMGELQPLFIEKKIIESRVHKYLSQGKTRYFIRQRLGQKKFDTVIIDDVLNAMKNDLENPDTYNSSIQDFCKKGQHKGFSRKKMFYELIARYPHAQKNIENALHLYNDRDILRNILIPHLFFRNSEEQIIQKCLQKGFERKDIQDSLREYSTTK